ncbi:VWA domain-containing protein [Clostridium perfringens]
MKSNKLTSKESINLYFNREKIFKRLNNIAYFILGEDKKINFKLNIGGDSFTDGKNVTVGLPELFIGREKAEILLALKALVAHEISHVVDSDFSVLSNFLKRESYRLEVNYQIPQSVGKEVAHHIYNSIEDGRIERRVVNRLRGIKKSINFLNLSFYEISKIKKEESTDFLYNITSLAVIGLDTKGFKEEYSETITMEYMDKIRPLIKKGIMQNTASSCADVCSQLLDVIGPYIKELYLKEEEFDNLNNFEDYNTSSPKNDDIEYTQSSHPFDEISSSDESSDNSNSNSSDKSSDNGNSNSSDKSSDNGNLNSLDESSNNGNSNSSDKSSDNGNLNSLDESSNNGNLNSLKEIERLLELIKNDALKEAVKEIDNIDKSDKKDKEMLKEEEKEREQYRINMEDILKINEKGKLKAIFNCEKNNIKNTNLKLDNYYSKKIRVFRRELEKLLKNKNEFNYKFQKRGTLDLNSLWRTSIDKNDIFCRKQIPCIDNYVFYILVDSSGSMLADNKKKEAFTACAILEEIVKGLIPLKIVSFRAYYNEVHHSIIKDFDDEKKFNYSLENDKLINVNNGNNDGFSIKVASTELLKRPEKNKVLIVLSDGLPSVSTITGRPVEDVKEAVKEARKSGINVFSVFFGLKSERERNLEVYKYMYGQNIINSEIEDISYNLMKLFKRTVFK